VGGLERGAPTRQHPRRHRLLPTDADLDHIPRAAEAGKARDESRQGQGRLTILEPKERRGTAFAISADVGIGRDADNTIVITGDSYISARHARISLTEGFVIVEDLGSRNGTYLNGTRLTQPHTVHPGDRIQVGYTVLEAQ
jgi:pSer/pThr/pTyr-binding forkhead associated (FHA) protein